MFSRNIILLYSLQLKIRHSQILTGPKTRLQIVDYAFENSGTVLKWLVSSLTRRECNVIAVRNDKKKHRDVYAAGARECLVRAVTCRSRMHAESARKCLQRPANRAFFLAVQSRNVEQRMWVASGATMQWEPPGACRCTLQRLSIARISTVRAGGDSIFIGISFGCIRIRYNRIGAVRSQKNAHARSYIYAFSEVKKVPNEK